MNKKLYDIWIIKAGLLTCLFLSPCFNPKGWAQEWKFDPVSQKAYDAALNLQAEEALRLLPAPRNSQERYVVSLAQAIDLAVTEDLEKYDRYHDAYEKRLEEKSTSSNAEDLFLKAELRLQWMFLYLKFSHELDAAWNLREAYQLTEECKKRFPDFTPIHKTSGLLQVLIGSVPEKYNWLLNLLGIEGSIDQGLNELATFAHPGDPFFVESTVTQALIHGYVLQNTGQAVKTLNDLLLAYPENKIILFLGAAAAIKNSASEDALQKLAQLEKADPSLALPYANYLKAEAYLHKAAYANSIAAYRSFIDSYKGQNYIKDAHYKIGLCHWLNGNESSAKVEFNKAKGLGKEESEADKYAARSLTEEEFPHVSLTKVRYYTDGGYYKEAESVLKTISKNDLKTDRDQVEYYYRYARFTHKTGQNESAKFYYQKVIDASVEESWYFAPNSCLQAGYLMLEEDNKDSARNYFQKAMTYPRHPYKNSIDSKAKSALSQLKTRK